MARTRKELGDRGESAAMEYLLGQGYTVVKRNHRRRRGEIDFILRHNDLLVFCEVKTSHLTHASENYTARQQKRQRALVLSYLAYSGWQGPVRVDLLTLERQPDSPHFQVHHFQDVLFDEA